MDRDDIKQISAWLAATDITALEIRGPGTYLRLRHDSGAVTASTDEPPSPSHVVTIAAQTVGVFLHRHPLHEAALAPLGSRVRTGQVLGLLRIGALLLPVTASEPGVVAAIQVAHGTRAGFGTALIALHPLPA